MNHLKSNLFIPKRIKVGYQSRNDTYTKKLAYVIYYDNKDKLRKEASWQSWRDQKIEPDEFDNVPTDGFVLNKKVGGYASDWGNFRQAYVRVYDPRGFEFEITVPNLLFILENTSSIKGKGLEGEFVYGWDGTDLVLMPTCSPDYEQLHQLNEQRFKNETVKAKDLKIGATYLHNSNAEWVYMGRFDYYDGGYVCNGQWFPSYNKAAQYAKKNGFIETTKNFYGTQENPKTEWGVGNAGKIHFFYDRANECFQRPKSLSGVLIGVLSEEPALDYADLFDKLESDPSYSPYDESKDERVRFELEELQHMVDDMGTWGFTVKTEEGIKVGIYKVVDDERVIGYACRHSSNRVLEECFKFHQSQTGWRGLKVMEPVPFEEIFNKFHFFYTKQYLANGKYYRAVYT